MGAANHRGSGAEVLWNGRARGVALALAVGMISGPVRASGPAEDPVTLAKTAYKEQRYRDSGVHRVEAAAAAADPNLKRQHLGDATELLVTHGTDVDVARLRDALQSFLDALRSGAFQVEAEVASRLEAQAQEHLAKVHDRLPPPPPEPVASEATGPGKTDRPGTDRATIFVATGATGLAVGVALGIASFVGMARGNRLDQQVMSDDLQREGDAANRLAVGAGVAALVLAGAGTALVVIGIRHRRRNETVALTPGLGLSRGAIVPSLGATF